MVKLEVLLVKFPQHQPILILVVAVVETVRLQAQVMVVQVVQVLLSSEFPLHKTKSQSSLTQQHGMCQRV